MAVSDSAYDPLTAVPAERRVFALRDAFALWFSLGVGLLVLQAGALLVPGLSLGWALVAILCGTVVGVAPMAAAGVMGADAGLSSIGTLRPALGVRGASIPAVLNVVQLLGWGSFEIIVMADAANALSTASLGVAAPVVWTVFFGVLATALAVSGPLAFVRRFLRDWGLLLILAASSWLTYALLSQHDLGALWNRPGTGALGFGAAVDIVAAMPLSWLPVIADYNRFGRSPNAMFRGSAAGYAIANVWFYALGATYALASDGGSITATLALTGGGLALLFILFDETDNAFAAIHSASVSGGTLARFPVPRIAIGFGAFCTLVALLVPIAEYEGFLLLIGSVFAPLFGVALADHFILRKRRIEASEIDRRGGAYWFTGGWRIPGLVSWSLGVAVYQGVTMVWPDLGATLPSMATSAVALVLSERLRRSTGDVAGRRPV